MEITVENLDRAVNLFYQSEARQQAEAHQWLTEAQNSTYAWSFVWELLNPQRSFEVQFFAATTLHSKIMKHWSEVPVDQYENLKKRLLEAIVNYANGHKIVLNRLCIALSAYIVHTIPDHWPNAFEELVSSFQPHHLPNVEPERVVWILLEILSMIPQEFHSASLALSAKNIIRTVLHGVSKDILKVVEMCLMPVPAVGFDMSNLTTYVNAARCAVSWIHLGVLNIDECDNIINLLIDLTCFVYWKKDDPEGAEELEIIEITVEALTAIIQAPDTFKYEKLVRKHSANMLYKFEKILENERNSPDPNKDIVSSIYGVLITMADSHSKLMVSNLKSANPEEQRITHDYLSCVLKCTNLPGLYPVDETSSSLSFAFWYTLQEDVLSLPPAECTQLLLLIKPYYRDLVCVMLRKSMFPISEDNWSLDDREVFRCYRQDIADTYMYAYSVLNLEMLDILYNKLEEALGKNKTNKTARIQWNEVETCLHAFDSVAESIEMENLYLPKLMEIIKNIPYSELNIKVMSIALDTVGSYAEWITEHPEVLQNVFPLVISALSNTDVSTSATMALKDLSDNCQKYILPYAEHILITSQTVIQSGILKLGDLRRLMFSVGKVLSILQVDKIMEYLNVMLASTFDEMQSLLNTEPSVTVATSLGTRMKILSSLFNTLYVQDSQEQPTLLIMQSTMPLYRLIGEKYCTNQEVIEDLSCLLKSAVTTLMDGCKPILGDVLQLVVTIYKTCPQSNVLSIIKTITIMFGKEEEFLSLNQQVMHEVVNTTLQMCSDLSVSNQLSNKTDVVEGFFAMLSQLSKKVPHLIFAGTIDTTAVFQCAILCLELPEIQTLKYCSYFLVNFISQSRETAQASVIQTYGESLVLRILLNLGNSTTRYSVEVFSDIFLALNKKYCDNLSRWLHSLLSQEGFPSPKITTQQKEEFIKSVLREKANKRKLSVVVLQFTLLCRGILKYDDTLQ